VDVVLVNPGSLKAVYQDLGRDLSAIEPPSLAGLFATYLRRKGVDVRVLISRIITHAELDRGAAMSESWKLVSFWADVLRH